MLARNNGRRESCREQVVLHEQMLVFLTSMPRNFKMQTSQFRKEKKNYFYTVLN